MKSDPLTDLWAKDTRETLLAHTLNVVRVAQQLCANLPFAAEDRAALSVLLTQLAAFHDLGKCASGFQAALRSKQSWGHRHEILSTALAAQLNPQLEAAGLLAIITHHRSLPPSHITEQEKCLPNDELPFDDAPTWQAMVAELQTNADALQALLDELTCQTGLALSPLSLGKLDSLGLPEAWLQRLFQPRRVNALQRRHASLLRGLLVTSDHMASAGMVTVPAVPRLTCFEPNIRRCELENESARPFQERCRTLEGNAILRAPTGSGKTFAVALWAMRNQVENGRFFYVLPHTASINAMYRRLLGWFYGDKNLVGVLHHRNAAFLFELQEDDNPRERAKQAKALADLAHEMYHPIRVCTPHQILRTSLRGRGWEMGLAEFSNACFVFDEVHAFEPLLVGLTLATARWLKQQGAKLLFASATLPKFLERLLVETLDIPPEHILSPDPTKLGDREVCEKVRHHIKIREGSLLDNLPRIISEIKESQQTTLIVCNHVATSQAVWRTLRDKYDIAAALLHARFNARDRARIERDITSAAPPRVLVATQAVEVSLDLDYERGYSEPAPADALGQRFGRINRRGARPPAPVFVFEQPSAGHLYDETTTQRTVELLAQVGLLTEQRLTDIVDKVYAEGYQGQSLTDYQQGLSHPIITQFEQDIIAGTHRHWVEDVIQGADRQVEVLPSELLPKYQALVDERRYLEAHGLLVPIRLGQHFKALRDGTVAYDKRLREWVTTLRYSPESGLDLAKEVDNIL
jgi:CRISPR-associated endonuclease/helicase Cas3